ncbi:MAG TPA: hypothetical protein VHL14_10950 [Steroidobacteraceae bacterium]|nr:hypothetical protein [Steroidobacteraceae bacterium]
MQRTVPSVVFEKIATIVFASNAEQRELNLVAVSLSASATPVLQEFFDRNPEYLHICNGHAAQNNEVLQWLKSQGTKWIRFGVVKGITKQMSSVRDKLRLGL